MRQIIEANTPIPCTGCAYCTHGCPKNIAIPQYFALYNSVSRTTGSFSSQNVYYNNISLKHGKASDCIGCGQCERACPQHLPIREHLKEVAVKFEAGASFPTRR
ncbi:4Fe-4S dicluster domain-containing protein [uncultured Gemmiger sp.]|uniref:4Fe-4S dicluster domain-containing protein n=1 Tax=uncultured Gemmiger sp. TaxID=1623490 RepID=UPI0025E38243|nr:4Fe-4S dicluster domain-containing protein [uncultured Gemmiger sp.]